MLLVEVATATLFLSIYLKFGFGLEFWVVATAASLLLALAIIDFEHQLILNKMVLPAIAAALVVAPFWTSIGVERGFAESSGLFASTANSVLSGLGAFLIFFAIAMVYPAGMGGGDVKMAGLIGLLVGFPGVFFALWGAVVVGGVVAILLLAFRKKGRKDAIPFGPFLSLGGIVVLLVGSEIASGYQDLVSQYVGL